MATAGESNHRDAKRVARNAAQTYSGALERLRAEQFAQKRRERILGYSKLAIAALTAASAVWLRHDMVALSFLIAPTAGFIVLAVVQQKLIVAISYHQRAIAYYEHGLARLDDRWAGKGETGDRFLDPTHPYARDLDIFGRASLFEYLSTARTRAGEDTLARWLLGAADAAEILARQQAVAELETRVKLREQIFCAGETVRLGVHPERLAEWGAAVPVFAGKRVKVAASVLALLWLASLVVWAVWNEPLAPLMMTVLNFAFAHRLHERLERTAGGLERASQDLALLADVLALIEAEPMESAKLRGIQRAWRRDGIVPSTAIRKLARIVDLLESRHSLFAKPFDLVTYWSAQLVFIAERWQQTFGPSIGKWLEAVGEFEALASLSSFWFEHPDAVFPEFVQDGPVFSGEGMTHPLLARGSAVANDVVLCKTPQLIVLSGPNMAGKSTFIRCIGVNAVLAQCGAPVCARRMSMSGLQVAASICVLDSLTGGVSRFYAEIRRLKLIADLAQGNTPVLFLLDELLSGTNSHDRFIGTEYVLRSLIDRDAIGIVSTHDLALARIPDTLGGRAINCHFEDSLEGGQLLFDYQLKPGIVQTSNALRLMQAIGLGPPPTI